MFLLIFICFLNYQSIEAGVFKDMFNSWSEEKNDIIADIVLTIGTAYALKKTIDAIKEENKVIKQDVNFSKTANGKDDDSLLQRRSNYAYSLGERISKTGYTRALWIATSCSFALILARRLTNKLFDFFK